MYISTLGQDSHAYDLNSKGEHLIMVGGYKVPNDYPVLANSDGDTVLHAITNAVSGFTTRNILGSVADKICLEQGIKDSSVYLNEALKDLRALNAKIVHVSMSIECKRPKLSPHIEGIRSSLSSLLDVDPSHIGITATTGEGLTAFGRGEGMQVFVILTICSQQPDA